MKYKILQIQTTIYVHRLSTAVASWFYSTSSSFCPFHCYDSVMCEFIRFKSRFVSFTRAQNDRGKKYFRLKLYTSSYWYVNLSVLVSRFFLGRSVCFRMLFRPDGLAFFSVLQIILISRYIAWLVYVDSIHKAWISVFTS